MSEWERKALEAADKFSKEEHAHRKTKKELAKIKADCDKYIQETGFKVLKLIDDNKSLQSRLEMAVECLKESEKTLRDALCLKSEGALESNVELTADEISEVLKQIQGE